MNEDGNYLEAHSAIHELNIIYDCYRVMFVIQYIVTSAIVHTTVCYYNRLRLWTSGVWTKRGGGGLEGVFPSQGRKNVGIFPSKNSFLRYNFEHKDSFTNNCVLHNYVLLFAVLYCFLYPYYTEHHPLWMALFKI